MHREGRRVKRETRIQLIVLLFVLVVVGVWPTVAGYYTDWLWFGEVGYPQVFATGVITRLGLGAVVAGLTFLILFGNFRLALRHFDQPYLVLGVSPADGAPVVLQRRGVARLIAGVSAAGAIFAGTVASNQWMSWLNFRHATPFGDRDPVAEPGTATGTPGDWWPVFALVPDFTMETGMRMEELQAVVSLAIGTKLEL